MDIYVCVCHDLRYVEEVPLALADHAHQAIRRLSPDPVQHFTNKFMPEID